QQVLIAGDMLSDTELPLPFYPDDLPSYIEALHLLEPFAAEAQLVIPGHGTIGTDAVARLKKDRRYINEVLENGHSNDPRIANLGMQEEYEHLQSIVSSQRS